MEPSSGTLKGDVNWWTEVFMKWYWWIDWRWLFKHSKILATLERSPEGRKSNKQIYSRSVGVALSCRHITWHVCTHKPSNPYRINVLILRKHLLCKYFSDASINNFHSWLDRFLGFFVRFSLFMQISIWKQKFSSRYSLCWCLPSSFNRSSPSPRSSSQFNGRKFRFIFKQSVFFLLAFFFFLAKRKQREEFFDSWVYRHREQHQTLANYLGGWPWMVSRSERGWRANVFDFLKVFLLSFWVFFMIEKKDRFTYTSWLILM